MVTRKEYPNEKDYQRALARWRRQENQRLWKIKNDANPIVLIPEEDRVMPETWSVAEAYWHRVSCECGSCIGPIAQAVKQYRLRQVPTPPAVRSKESPLPVIPDPTLHRLLDVVKEVLSKVDFARSLHQE